MGGSRLGRGPYGFGEPPGAPPKAGQLFLDPRTGTIGTGRRIDPGSRQYVLDGSGRIGGQDSIPQMVYLAYATVQGSSVLPTLGETFSEVQTMGDDFIPIMTARATEPIQNLIDAGQVAIVSVNVQRLNDRVASISVLWRDLTTGLEHTTSVL